MVVGIGGGYCSGKSTVAQILIDAGYREVNVDALGHSALMHSRDQVVERFGPQILAEDGAIDRARLGAVVFADQAARRDLEQIVHPRMVEEARELIEAAGVTPVAMHAALLFPMGLDRLCDRILWVRAPLFTRIRRGMARDNRRIGRILRILWTQRTLRPQPGPESADIDSVVNRGNRDALVGQLRRLRLPGI